MSGASPWEWMRVLALGCGLGRLVAGSVGQWLEARPAAGRLCVPRTSISSPPAPSLHCCSRRWGDSCGFHVGLRGLGVKGSQPTGAVVPRSREWKGFQAEGNVITRDHTCAGCWGMTGVGTRRSVYVESGLGGWGERCSSTSLGRGGSGGRGGMISAGGAAARFTPCLMSSQPWRLHRAHFTGKETEAQRGAERGKCDFQV